MAANQDFQYDVFLSHSAKDKAVVRPLAERLQQDGLKVRFDEWVLPVAASRQSAAFLSHGPIREAKDGGALPRRRYAEKIEAGLEPSNFGFAQPGMSAHACVSDWAQLEAGTFRFPKNGGLETIAQPSAAR